MVRHNAPIDIGYDCSHFRLIILASMAKILYICFKDCENFVNCNYRLFRLKTLPIPDSERTDCETDCFLYAYYTIIIKSVSNVTKIVCEKNIETNFVLVSGNRRPRFGLRLV